jgi:RecA-family ATPase
MVRGVYPSLGAFFEADIEEPEEILFGVHRGEVAGLLAMTNYGKSTALLNATLSLAAGEACWPLVPEASEPRRILYIDSESPATCARADLRKMIHGVTNSRVAKENFVIVVDASINGEPLNLSRNEHFKRIVALGKIHRADLVIVDTAASTFELQDENSNAEVTKRVMNPLKRLAREVNCAVFFTHHIGKGNETQTGEAAYRGRGASAFGALSRVIFTIERDAKKGTEYIVLSCAKIKGQPFEPVLMKLNMDTRWFEICAERPESKPESLTAQDVAAFVAEQIEARTKDIKNHFKDRASARTVADRIADAEHLGLIMKPNEQAPWSLCNGKKAHFEDSAQLITESTGAAPVQLCNSYKGLHSCTVRVKWWLKRGVFLLSELWRGGATPYTL